MSVEFYSVNSGSAADSDQPWIEKIIHGLSRRTACKVCGTEGLKPSGELTVTVDKRGSTRWPDALGCGHYPLLVLSNRVLRDWSALGVEVPHAPIRFETEVPPGRYYWIDGAQLRGACLDFAASGFVGVEFCSGCGKRTHIISETYRKQHERRWPIVFEAGSWAGQDLFTTDLSPTSFFCTKRLLDCAREKPHTNLIFIPIDKGRSEEFAVRF